jgi:hypothetical protein
MGCTKKMYGVHQKKGVTPRGRQAERQLPKGSLAGSMRLDIRELRKRGSLAPSTHWSVEWTGCDGSKSSIAFKSESCAIILAYRCSAQEESISEHVALEWSPCRFGGSDPFFFVPDAPLRRKYFSSVAVGFGHACARVAYTSQNQQAMPVRSGAS